MKPFEVALFKHFIESKGMATVYINLYRKHHVKKNPTSIEEFLFSCETNEVCTDAFYFVINERWGFDYWTRTQDEWMAFLHANENNYSADEWWKLQGLSKILRCNWDAAKHWRHESRQTAAVRLGIDLALLGLDGKKNNEEPTKLAEEYLREKDLEAFKQEQQERKSVELLQQEPECPTHDMIDDADFDDDNKEVDILGDFVDVCIKPCVSSKRRLNDDEISVNVRNKSNRITFNQAVSIEIQARGGYEYATLLSNKHGDVVIKLNDENGVPFQDGTTHAKDHPNAVIHSQVLVEKLVAMLGIERDYEIVNIKEVAKTNDFVAYLVTRQ